MYGGCFTTLYQISIIWCNKTAMYDGPSPQMIVPVEQPVHHRMSHHLQVVLCSGLTSPWIRVPSTGLYTVVWLDQVPDTLTVTAVTPPFEATQIRGPSGVYNISVYECCIQLYMKELIKRSFY